MSRKSTSQGLDRRALLVLSAGHTGADLCIGAVPALVPFFVSDRGLDYTSASALVLVMTTTSSLLQPVFGILVDRIVLAWIAPVALLAAGTGLVLMALTQSFAVMALAVGISGIGIAAFHPEGARRADHAAGDRRATAFGYFSVGGNAGFALAPIIITPLALAFGVEGAAIAALVPAALAVMLAIQMPRLIELEDATASSREASPDEGNGERWGLFALVAGIAASRSGVFFGLQAFLASFLIAEHAFGEGVANAALAVMLSGAAGGTVAGGYLSDRVGRLPMLIGGLAALPPLILALIADISFLAFPLAGIAGFVYGLSFTSAVVLGHECLPDRLGLTSAVTLGAAMGAGGLVAAALGPLADSVGLTAVILVLAALPLPGLAMSLLFRRIGGPLGRRQTVGAT